MNLTIEKINYNNTFSGRNVKVSDKHLVEVLTPYFKNKVPFKIIQQETGWSIYLIKKGFANLIKILSKDSPDKVYEYINTKEQNLNINQIMNKYNKIAIKNYKDLIPANIYEQIINIINSGGTINTVQNIFKLSADKARKLIMKCLKCSIKEYRKIKKIKIQTIAEEKRDKTQINRLRKYISEGLTILEAGKKEGLSYHSVCYLIKKYNIKTNAQTAKSIRKRVLMKHIKRKNTTAVMSKDLKVSTSTVCLWIRELFGKPYSVLKNEI